ncbi:hypothetical protein [Bacillus thuringiensis]|uniref:hypothetical protein n=1 Tax=Bacillus thuringiensis TaxID=1428 RepID=UPI000BFDB8F6|nr:hypothetical protein [Bacillus thuringiensis]PGW55255.1 hypothetical protein COE03_05120 [Bacillus thuringiensis]
MFTCLNTQCNTSLKNLKNNSQIPIILIVFNNLSYLKNMLKQLKQKKIKDENIWIWDNNSTYSHLLTFYKQLTTYNIIQNDKNYGPHFFTNPLIWDLLPDFFAISDPDVSFNENMPDDFLKYLKNITINLSVFKAGLALDISHDANFNEKLRSKVRNVTIREWETQFWTSPLQEYTNPQIYKAHIDTTFAVYNKKLITNGFFDAVRVADYFTCKHLPWYKNNAILEEEKKLCHTKWSWWGKT